MRHFIFSILFASVLSAQKSGYETVGDLLQIALPLTAISTTVVLKDYDGSLAYVKALSSTLATTYALKYSVNETRPNGGEHSFPSGHTSAAFSGASFIQRRYGWAYGMPAYLAATYVAWSRVHAKAHYTHDVIVGAVIGVGFTYLFTDPYKSNTTITPLAYNGSYGVMLSHRF